MQDKDRYNSIDDIYNRLKEIMTNPKNESLDLLGSYIIGSTIVRDDVDEYLEKYPILDEIVGLAADLETVDDINIQKEIIDTIKSKMITFRGILIVDKEKSQSS